MKNKPKAFISPRLQFCDGHESRRPTLDLIFAIAEAPRKGRTGPIVGGPGRGKFGNLFLEMHLPINGFDSWSTRLQLSNGPECICRLMGSIPGRSVYNFLMVPNTEFFTWIALTIIGNSVKIRTTHRQQIMAPPYEYHTQIKDETAHSTLDGHRRSK